MSSYFPLISYKRILLKLHLRISLLVIESGLSKHLYDVLCGPGPEKLTLLML